MNIIYRTLLIFSFPVLLIAAKPIDFKVTGIHGDLLSNVQERLVELYQQKSIATDSLETLKQQIAKAMHPYGYFQPDIAIVRNKRLYISINPGRQMLISDINVKIIGDGENNNEIKQVLQILPIQKGQVLNNNSYNKAKELLVSAAEQQGYLHANFVKSQLIIDKKKYTARIDLIFDTGHQYYFGQIHFDPTYISPELLHRYVRFKHGEIYSTEDILAFNSHLNNSGYFKTVDVKPLISDDSHVPIRVNLQPIDRANYSLGLGYGTDTGPRGRTGLHIVPINPSGHKFNAIVQGSLKENALLAQYLIPGKNPVTDNYAISGSLSNFNYSTGYSNSYLLSLGQQHRENDSQRILSINGLHERYNYDTEAKSEKNLLFPKLSFTWRQADEPLFSTNGYNINLIMQGSSTLGLSDINFAQAVLDAKLAITVAPIHSRLFFHGIQGITQTHRLHDLPLSLAMLLGGADNLKAYGYNSIGPGKLMSFGSVEIQKETFEKWYLIGFVEAGSVYQPNNRLIKYDAGVGFMWVSPVGPIKISIAQGVDNHLHQVPNHIPKLVINMGPDL
ncbi:MAG: autotransporter assembly complex protein TamA [Legionella sp.]